MIPHPDSVARDARSGSVLLSTLLVSFILMASVAALVTNSLYRSNAERGRVELNRAEEIAETGLNVAYFEVQSGSDVTGDAIGDATADWNGGRYAATVSPAYAGAGTYTLTSTGTYGTHHRTIRLVVSAQTTSTPGFIGLNKITISGGASVDSFDASIGTYASQVVGGHAGKDGDIATNGSISTSGAGKIFGDATPGPAGTYGGSMGVTGSTTPASQSISVAPYVYSPPLVASGAWNGPGTLNGGTHRYTSLTVSGGGVLTLKGNITIYCDNKFTISGGSSIVVAPGAQVTIHQGANDVTVSGGGIVNQNAQASTLTFNSASTTKVTVSGTSAYFGSFYCPAADFVASGGSGLYGAVVAKTITLSSGTGWLHYDTSLNKLAAGSFKVVMERGW